VEQTKNSKLLNHEYYSKKVQGILKAKKMQDQNRLLE
jgi:hypothetical protein